MGTTPAVRNAAVLLALLLACTTAAGSFRFIVTGDSRGSDNGVNRAILLEMRDACLSENPAFVLFPGDLVSTGTEAELRNWAETFMAPLLAASIGVFPCRGNHEPDVAAWNAVFTGPWQLPQNGPAGETNLTYSFTYENALFLALDQVVAAHPYAVNQAWVDEQLAQSPEVHVFAFGHMPAFAVDHADCLAMHPEARDAFLDSIAAAGGRTYFCGHDHFYNHARTPWGSVGTLEQFVVGSAGAPLRTWTGTYPDPTVSAVAHFRNYGYLVVTVDGMNVSLEFKQRAAPGQYAAADSMTYEAAPEGAFAAGPVALLGTAMALAVLASVVLLRTSTRRAG